MGELNMDIILNEKSFVEKILEDGIVDKKPSKTIWLLAKYYNSLGIDKEQSIKNIDCFMKKNYKNKYNSVTWGDLVEGIVNQAIKNNFDLNNVESVNITKSEIDFIKSIGQKTLEKLTFTYLVYAKVLNQINPKNNNWVSSKYRTAIFKDANIGEKGSKQLEIIHKAVVRNIIVLSKNITNNSINVENYINENDSVVLVVRDFRELGLQYLKFIGEKNIVNCEVCKRLIVKTRPNSNIKYCKNCARKVKNRQNKLSKSKREENVKIKEGL